MFPPPSDMETYWKSNGQGKLHSHSHHRVSNLSSIVEGLVSRSLTVRGLDIEVHQHYGFRLHLLWKCNEKNCTRLEYCFERHFFNYTDLQTFCSELTTGGLGLCDCKSEDVCKFVKAKACYRDPKTHSQKYLNVSRAIREKEEYKGFRCPCPVSSASEIEWNKFFRCLSLYYIYR
jgi:hypothetical protein